MIEDFNDPEEENLEIITKLNKLEIITENIYSQDSYQQNFCHFHKGGRIFLIWATKDYYLEFYDLLSKTLFHKIKVHTDFINSVHHFHDVIGKRDLIITTSDDKYLKIYNFEDFSEIVKIENNTIAHYRNGFIFAEKSKSNVHGLNYYIITELSDYIVALYDFNGKFIRKIQNCWFFDLWHCPKTNICQVVGSYAGNVKLYELKSGKLTKEFKCHGTLVEAAIINDLLITGDDEGFLRTYNLDDNSMMNEIKLESPITHITVWDIEYLFVSLDNGFVHCYEAKTLTNVKIIKPVCEKIVYAESMLYPNLGPALIMTGPICSEKSLLAMITCEPHNPI